MTPGLVIITPELSPGSGGLADHTLALLRQWDITPERLTILVANPETRHQSAANVQQLGTSSAEILNQLSQTAGRVFVQYSAYGFNQFGYPRHLIRALIAWKKRGSHASLVVMFHEIWAFWSFTDKNFVIQLLHRRSIKRLLGVCDAVFTTTASQAEHLRALGCPIPIEVLPVGSNIRRFEARLSPRDNSLAVLFGLQPSRIRALEQMRKSLAALVSSGQLKRIATAGHGTTALATQRESELLHQLNLPAGFVQHGPLAEQQVSELLQSATFGIFGQNELSCQKSGSFMAYAAHQMNVIAEFADPTKPPPICWLVAPSELIGGVAPQELERRAQCLYRWLEENCSWEVIGNKIGRALGIGTGQANTR